MAEYIERSVAVRRVMGTKWERGSDGAAAMEIVASAPAVDAVPVVRCKDCKYYKPDEYECGCDFAGGLPYVKATDYCSYGERREANGK